MKNEMNTLNQRRLKMIAKGFLTVSDIESFVPCGYKKAKMLLNQIERDIRIEGKTVGMFGIDPRRVMNYLNQTETQIRKYAEDEVRIDR